MLLHYYATGDEVLLGPAIQIGRCMRHYTWGGNVRGTEVEIIFPSNGLIRRTRDEWIHVKESLETVQSLITERRI